MTDDVIIYTYSNSKGQQMNNIEVIGGSKSQKKYVVSMVQYCCNMLMPRMQTLDVEIHLN